ncbi:MULTISPECIES: protein-glutamate O-methyltransferase [unclassified Corallococcus]|uniref:protein-glutamate O-methyltransferase n=1 Tax=unclassified Corallococcus TaxID=2685029 RepID=UPI001A8D7D52|nr:MULTISPECIES: protein-glutamate O-methyltransferase [unclassified Corallococcus]MBN9684989.1 tetratricopeptide repeat protein [Corallococcus sp. NCSPR001]WAS83550.1 tetratricopeptide repeat protein [Corallococcus sp. NCRR]
MGGRVLNVGNKVLQQLSALLLERAGLKITLDGYHSLRLALSTRMPALGLSDPEKYLQKLMSASGEEELRALLPLVTVGHTEFFRDAKQFRALEGSVLPELLARARREMRKVSIWSAGCATGEEPYSLALVLAELGALAVEVDLWATDLNLAAVEAARQGRFSTRRAMAIGPERLKRFFRPVEDGYEASPILREYIRFDGQNLAAPVFDKVAPASLDLILCRNVIIYFDLPTIRGLMDRFLAALRPGGLLFLGYSESLFKVYDRFEMIEVDGAFVYRRPLGERPRPPAPLAPMSAEPRPGSPESFAVELRQRMQTNAETAARLRTAGQADAANARAADAPARRPTLEMPSLGALGGRRTGEFPAVRPEPARTGEFPAIKLEPPRPGEPPRRPATTGSFAAVRVEPPASRPQAEAVPARPSGSWPQLLPPAERLNMAVRKMGQGDFPAAIDGVKRLLVDEPSDLDALLTLGNLYSLTGRIDEARDTFGQALQREPLCVEARVFGGVAAMQAGSLAEARSELAKALFLEPTLAIGHYLLAQVQERTQDFEAARRSYRNAVAQLKYPQRPLAGHYPEMLDSAEAISRAARYALAALEEQPG